MGVFDIFNRSRAELARDYCLELDREFGNYRLQRCSGSRSADEDAVGILEGTVSRVGWNDRFVVAWRHPAFGGDSAGWMIVDTSTGLIEGPLSEESFSALQQQRDDLADIVPRPVEEVLR